MLFVDGLLDMHHSASAIGMRTSPSHPLVLARRPSVMNGKAKDATEANEGLPVMVIGTPPQDFPVLRL